MLKCRNLQNMPILSDVRYFRPVSFENGQNKNRTGEANVPHHAQSNGETRQGSSEDKLSETALWRIDLSINPALFRSVLGAHNGRPAAQIGKATTRPLSTDARKSLKTNSQEPQPPCPNDRSKRRHRLGGLRREKRLPPRPFALLRAPLTCRLLPQTV